MVTAAAPVRVAVGTSLVATTLIGVSVEIAFGPPEPMATVAFSTN